MPGPACDASESPVDRLLTDDAGDAADDTKANAADGKPRGKRKNNTGTGRRNPLR